MENTRSDSQTLSSVAGEIFHTRKSFLDSRENLRAYLEAISPSHPISERMDATLQLSKCEIETGNSLKAEELLHQCEDYILAYGSTLQQALLYNIYGYLHMLSAEFEKGLGVALKSLSLFTQEKQEYFMMNTNILCGHLCGKLNLFSEAIDYLSAAKSIAERRSDLRQSIICAMNLNELRIHVLPIEDCINNAKELLTKISKLQEKNSFPEAATNLQFAFLYLKAGNIPKAKKYADDTEIMLQRLTFLPPQHLLYVNLYAVKSEIAATAGDEASVLKYTQEQRSRAQMSGNVAAQADALFFLTTFYIRQNDLDTAKRYLEEATAKVGDDDKSDLYLNLHETNCAYYRAMKDSASELAHFRLIYDYKMKTQQQALSNRVKYMDMLHELDMHKNQIEHQTAELNMSIYYLQQKDTLLRELQDNIEEQKILYPRSGPFFQKMSRTIERALIREEDEKVRIREKFDKTNKAFIMRLHDIYPTLSPAECRMCVLLKSGFNTKEISSLLTTSTRTIENQRLSIRKKMGLKKDDNLNMKLTEVI